MDLLSNEHLHCRDFGSALLNADHLAEWLTLRRLRCPISLPAAYVQVEWLLSAIQRHTEDSVTNAEAVEIVRTSSRLSSHRCAGTNAAWLLGGEAYVQWSALLHQAVSSGELVLLDFSSKLPATLTKVIPEAAQEDEGSRGGQGNEWFNRARALAWVMIAKDIEAGITPRKRAVAQEITDLFAQDGTTTKNGRKIDSDYVERHALQGWSDMVAEQEKRKVAA
jgi:hypothetical protein